MAAGIYNTVIEQGTTFRKQLTWKDSTGNPVNLTGYTATMILRDKVAGDIKLTLSSVAGDIVITPSIGQLLITISPTVTSTLTLKKYTYDLDLTSPSGDVFRLLKGKIDLSEA